MEPITEDYVSFETAKLLKDKGFKPNREWNPEYVWMWQENEETSIGDLKEIKEEDYDIEGNYLRPTQAIALKWLRINHNIHIKATNKYNLPSEGYYAIINYLREDILNKGEKYLVTLEEYPNFDRGVYETGSYEQATEAAIQYTLKNLI